MPVLNTLNWSKLYGQFLTHYNKDKQFVPVPVLLLNLNLGAVNIKELDINFNKIDLIEDLKRKNEIIELTKSNKNLRLVLSNANEEEKKLLKN